MFHPAVVFLYWLAVILPGICLPHPVLLCLSLAGAILYYLLLAGRGGVKRMIGILLAAIVIAVVNPLFSAEGSRVLLWMPWGRPYTGEALVFGILTGTGCAAVLLWFAGIDRSGGREVILYLTAGRLPNLSLVLSMILRLLPQLHAKGLEIRDARACIGKSGANGDRKQRLAAGMENLSALATHALESSVITAASMKSRGCGSGRRSSFRSWRIRGNDLAVLLLLSAVLLLLLGGGMRGALTVRCYPELQIAGGPVTAVCAVCYGGLAFAPSLLMEKEKLMWKFLRSRI